MSEPSYPVGLVVEVAYPMFSVTLHLEAIDRIRFVIADGPFAREETVETQVVDLGNNLFAVSWQEADRATVVNVQNFDAGIVNSYATLPDGTLLRNEGKMTVRRNAGAIGDHSPHRNKALVIDAMTSLFQRHDAGSVERLYAADYRQHNPMIPQGREALRAIVENLDKSVFYEPGIVLAQGDMVAIHGRIRGWAPAPQIVVDLFRIQDGKLAEHWDVLQQEVGSASGAMFDPAEGK
ncbi:MoaF-related domain-containing protein [Ancylobacter oerskovii]|uniref:Nuclear transport factor 2 family protein n=1 Tax=Ancylobacter oerskovii TaxID=459519 RepID=A0ABW4Z4U8_9HYPH|nr:nuclear transport factor 2 family protein [Ancylobacter oerskovii]MBS7542497.1 nuclear transport factor 2 family protein [Ancylobacter oerskovii]